MYINTHAVFAKCISVDEVFIKNSALIGRRMTFHLSRGLKPYEYGAESYHTAQGNFFFMLVLLIFSSGDINFNR